MKILNYTVITLILSSNLYAGYFEVSAGGSYSNYKNSAVSSTKTQSINASFAYRFVSASAIELSYYNTKQIATAPYSSTYSKMDVASASLLIYIFGTKYTIQPYVKAGGGYMIRNNTYNTDGFESLTLRDDSFSANIGGGIKYYFTGNLALQGSATAYVTDFDMSSPYIHQAYSVGVTVLF